MEADHEARSSPCLHGGWTDSMTAGTAINGGRLASWFFDDRMSGGVASRPFDNVGKGGACHSPLPKGRSLQELGVTSHQDAGDAEETLRGASPAPDASTREAAAVRHGSRQP